MRNIHSLLILIAVSVIASSCASNRHDRTSCEQSELVQSYMPWFLKNYFEKSECEAIKAKHTPPERPPYTNKKIGPVPYRKYTYAPIEAAINIDTHIDVEKENSLASSYLRSIKNIDAFEYHAIIVPGYSTDNQKGTIHAENRERLDFAVYEFNENNAPVIIVSGGNVSPVGTPFNEAYEMKRRLMEVYKIPEHNIAIDPYARHSTTNIRNAGRFMLAHGLSKAMIVTSQGQNLYFGVQDRSTFKKRCEKQLGYSLGELLLLTKYTSEYTPSADVFKISGDRLDP